MHGWQSSTPPRNTTLHWLVMSWSPLDSKIFRFSNCSGFPSHQNRLLAIKSLWVKNNGKNNGIINKIMIDVRCSGTTHAGGGFHYVCFHCTGLQESVTSRPVVCFSLTHFELDSHFDPIKHKPEEILRRRSLVKLLRTVYKPLSGLTTRWNGSFCQMRSLISGLRKAR